MTFIEKLQAVRTVIVHDNCADGMASAILLHDALPEADIRFIQYGTVEHKELAASPNMLFCDFAPHEENVPAFVAAGTIVLDHHKTAKGIVEAFGENGRFGDEIANPGICGAMLAYEHVWLPLLSADSHVFLSGTGVLGFVRDFAVLAGVRDTWQTSSPQWDQATLQKYVLDFVPKEQWLSMSMTSIATKWDSDFSWIGPLLKKKQDKKVAQCVKGSYRFTTPKGTRAVVFEGVRPTSDAAELLGSEADLIIGFSMFIDEGNPKLIYSTRTRGTFNCAEFAKSHGGGGHTKAAGFNVPLSLSTPNPTPNPYTLAETLVLEYEAKGGS